METRARRQSLRAATASVPSEIWSHILSFLEPQQSVQASLVCSEFRSVSKASAHKAMERLWPQHKDRLNVKISQLGVQKVLALISAELNEAKGHPEVQKASKLQKMVLPEHRQIAVEWLIEVAWDWQLESTVVYRGTQYLDHYLSTCAVNALSKFQMLAISSLRTALKHSAKLVERERAKLPARHWAEVTDGACTEAEVRSTCLKLERLLQPAQRSHPNSKQRLRYLWYRLFDAGVVKQEHVYAYMLASFLLHLSLLDINLSAITPTRLAAAALSLALEVFGFEPWPQALQEHCLYLPQEMQETQDMLKKAQEELPASQLRALWVGSYSYIGTNPLQQPAYSHLQLIVSRRGKLQQLHALLSGAGRSGSSSSSSTITAAAAAVAAMNAATAVVQGVQIAAAAGMPPTAAAVAAAAGPVDGTVIVGVVPASTSGAVQAAAPAPTAAPAGRVTTRAAAAAGQQQRQHLQQQQQQNQPPAANTRLHGIAGATRNAGGSGSNITSTSQQLQTRHQPQQQLQTRLQQQQQLASGDRLLPTPQRTSIAPLSAAEQAPVRHHHPAGAASLMAGLTADNSSSAAAGSSNSHQPAGAEHASGRGAASAAPATARRCPTRELPARKAVVSSKYGCRGTQQPGNANAAASCNGAGSSSAAAAGSGFRAPAAAGPAGGSSSNSAAAAEAAPPAGSTTPASPKHHHHPAVAAANGHRGLAALFAGASCSVGGSNSGGAAPSTRSSTRANNSEGLQLALCSRSLDADDLQHRSLMEGTPQPPQLLALPQLLLMPQKRAAAHVAASAKHGHATRGHGGAIESANGAVGMDLGIVWAGDPRGSQMRAACQAAASAAAAAAGTPAQGK